MKYLMGMLLICTLILASGLVALAGDCTYKPYVRDNNVVGTMVINEFNTYCGYAAKHRNGIRLYVDNEGKYEQFSKEYEFEDVLRYLCSKCAYEFTEESKSSN